jgi:hypothetical protein
VSSNFVVVSNIVFPRLSFGKPFSATPHTTEDPASCSSAGTQKSVELFSTIFDCCVWLRSTVFDFWHTLLLS